VECIVSINCITYNHEDYIAEAIEGFLMQKTNFDFEILIGEDCSTDHTLQIVEEYVKKYPEKIKLISSESNVGSRENAVRLHKNSKGKYIALCEGDDYWIDPYKLQKQINFLKENRECTLCFHNAFFVKGTKKINLKSKKTLVNKVNYYFREDGNYSAGDLAMLGFIPTASYVYPKYLLDDPPEWYYTALVGDIPIKLISSSYGYAHFMNENMSVYRTAVKGSVTYNWRKESGNKEKQIKINRGFLELFNNFNDFTQNKYKEEIDNTKIQFELEIERLERNLHNVKSLKYKKYFKRIGLAGSLKFYAKYSFPTVYLLFTRIKEYV